MFYNINSDIIRSIFQDDGFVMEEEIRELYNSCYSEEYEIEDICEIDEEIFTKIINDIVHDFDTGIIELKKGKETVLIKIHNKGKRRKHVSIHNENKFKITYPLETFWWIEVITCLYEHGFKIIK